MNKGNTRRSERRARQTYFTLAEIPQVDMLLNGEDFSRWVRRKLAEEAAKQNKHFDNDLPERGKYERQK